MKKYEVAVRTTIEVTVYVDALSIEQAQRRAHDWVEENVCIKTWSDAHELRRLLDDDPVSWANCTEFEMHLEPEDYEAEEIKEN